MATGLISSLLDVAPSGDMSVCQPQQLQYRHHAGTVLLLCVPLLSPQLHRWQLCGTCVMTSEMASVRRVSHCIAGSGISQAIPCLEWHTTCLNSWKRSVTTNALFTNCYLMFKKPTRVRIVFRAIQCRLHTIGHSYKSGNVAQSFVKLMFSGKTTNFFSYAWKRMCSSLGSYYSSLWWS